MTGWMQRKANGCCERGGYDLSCKRKNSQNTALRRGRVSAVDMFSLWTSVPRGTAALLGPRNALEIAAGFSSVVEVPRRNTSFRSLLSHKRY